ncbi:hypothetical protein EBX31_06035 [bacterium]|nr:hypothetical protein [bacterium]
MDFAFGLDVKKSQIILPPSYLEAIEKGKTSKGLTFREYLKTAEQTVRRRQLRQNEMPVIPVGGMPVSVTAIFREALKKAKVTKSRDINFVWTNLIGDDVFDISQSEETIYLNQKCFSSALTTFCRWKSAAPNSVPALTSSTPLSARPSNWRPADP